MKISRWLAFVCFVAPCSPVLADPGFGTRVDQRCTANGWVPARPYNPNNLVTTDPTKVNCALCHTTAVPKKSGVNAAGYTFLNSGFTNVTPFCAPPPPLNHPPTFAAVGVQQATVAQLLQLAVTATDVDGDAIALSVSNSPTGATFSDNGNGTGTFSWTPGANQTGNRTVTFHATDAGAPMATASLGVTISVGSVTNRPPTLAPIGNKQVDAGTQLSIALSASDPDNNTLSFTAQPLPTGATLVGTMFRWTPTLAQVGNHSVTFRVADSGNPQEVDSEAIVISVGRVNRPPQLSAIGNRMVDLGQMGRIPLVATDPDGDRIALACMGLPVAATLTDMLDGTGEIVWSPASAGIYSVTCSATDNGLPAGVATDSFQLSARDPAPAANAPVIDGATARRDHRRWLLRVTGTASTANPDPKGAHVEIFAVLSDGAAVKIGGRRTNRSGQFEAALKPFVVPCQVAAAVNGLMGSPMAVAGAPASCDTEVLMAVRAKSSCSGFSLRVKIRRAPANAIVTGTDLATGDVAFSITTTRSGPTSARAPLTSFMHALEVHLDAAGHRWILPAPVEVKRDCH